MTSGNFSIPGLKFCKNSELRGAYTLSVATQLKTQMIKCVLIFIDTPYENVKEGQDWWKTVDLPADEKEMVGRINAIRL